MGHGSTWWHRDMGLLDGLALHSSICWTPGVVPFRGHGTCFCLVNVFL